jgi:hypothetical protein
MSTLAENALDENSAENEVAAPLAGAPSLEHGCQHVSTTLEFATIAQGPRSSAVVFQETKGVVYHILVSE